MCDFATKLTLAQSTVTRDDADLLRAHGLDDEAVSSAIQVIGYFNYITRVADAVGIEGEPEWLADQPADA